MKIINLTPHEIKVLDLGIAPSGQVARVGVNQEQIGSVQIEGLEISVVANGYGDVQGLPDPQDGVVYLVSTMVLQALESAGLYRPDVFAPDTGPTALRENGQIKAVTRLVGMKPH